MNKDRIVAEIKYEERMGTPIFHISRKIDHYLPYGCNGDINIWIHGRSAAKHRKAVEAMMRECGILNGKRL